MDLFGELKCGRKGRHTMKKSKFTEEQIAWALKQRDLGTPVQEVCRKLGIAKATFFNWKKRYGGMSRCRQRRSTE